MYIHCRRRLKIFYSILLLLCLIAIHKHASNIHQSRRESFDEVKSLISQLFDSSQSLRDCQRLWNQLMNIWQEILRQFLDDACQLCRHQIHFDCRKSVDLSAYIRYINQSFYPFNESTRPNAMGFNYFAHLPSFHSSNHSLLPTDVTWCDYFQMIHLLMRVQIILHRMNTRYFLTKGTLIGTLRHHDIIPWDTDIDLFLPNNAMKILLKNLSSTRQDLVILRFRNSYGISSYKIFSEHSPRVNGTDYRWPKIDLFLYQENTTHLYAFPKHQHNLGTMSVINRTHIEPLHLRLLGPLLVPSPKQPRKSLKAMVKLGPSNVFDVCEGNRYSSRDNQQWKEPWRVPCKELHSSYFFVRAQRNSTTGLCEEELISSRQNSSLSYYLYRCDEHLSRSVTE